jgi:uncharacterized protein
VTAPFADVLTSQADLDAVYSPPHELVVRKCLDHVDAGTRAFIEAAPFVAVGTAHADGSSDVSPRGGHAGFVKVLDEKRIVIPDLNGNNRIDSLRNIVSRPHVGLLFLIPGRGETLRVNGRAWVTTADDVLDLFVDEYRRPTAAIGVEVQETYIHCAKAFRRSGLWDPSTWHPEDGPNPMQMFVDALGLDATAEQVEADLEAGYAAGLAYDEPVCAE